VSHTYNTAGGLVEILIFFHEVNRNRPAAEHSVDQLVGNNNASYRNGRLNNGTVGGDSGGPWFAYTTAYGIQSACGWKDTSKTITQVVVYTSVDYLRNIGVTLVF